MTIKELQNNAYKNACEKGFHDKETNIGESLMLIVSELGEALEADRKGLYTSTRLINLYRAQEGEKDPVSFSKLLMGKTSEEHLAVFRAYIKDTFEDELADVVIRIADLCGALEISLEDHIRIKMCYNESRENLHGKRY
jgi:NTP pyrophosphatase (non-canonical NTP hydrolase)